MKFKLPWQKKNENAELESMENLLDSIFKPVGPSKEFSNKLRSDLIGRPKRKLFGLEIPNAKMGWALVGGIFGTVILIANAIISIMRFAKLLDKAGKKKKNQIHAAI
jgi:hypothetical protein